VTNAAGAIVSAHDYFPFGKEIGPITRSPSTHRFTGHEHDPETDMEYMKARYYGPGLGRFLSVDPGDDTWLGDPQSWNKYAYVQNNPIRLTDPTGQFSFPQGPHSPKPNWKFLRQTCYLCDGAAGASGTGGDSGGEAGGSVPIDLTNIVEYVSVVGIDPGPHGAGGRGDAIEDASIGLVDLATWFGPGAIVKLSLKGLVTSFIGRKAARGAGRIVDPNKLHHIFGKTGHNLGPLVQKFGSQEATFSAVQQATQAAIKSQGLSGVFETTVSVAGQNVVVRGNVVEGVARIGTFFTP